MTTNTEIQHKMRHDKSFLGVFATDTIPDPKNIPFGKHLICNFSKIEEQGTHWIWMHTGGKDTTPLYFDPLGHSSNGIFDSKALGVDNPHFDTFLRHCAQRLGYSYYRQNTIPIEKPDETTCGELSTWAAMTQQLPNDIQSRIVPAWAEIVYKSKNMSSKSFEKYIIRKLNLRKNNTNQY